MTSSSLLRRSHIISLAHGFTDSDKKLWRDIELLAGEFWRSQPDNQLRAWHHLLMAVGNFKRPGGTIIRIPTLEGTLPQDVEARPEVDIPGPSDRLSVNEPETWSGLEDNTRGLGVATTTTLLSALWPGHHVVIDQRALRAAIARSVNEWQPSFPLQDTDKRVDWPCYGWYRPKLLHTAKAECCAPVEVERALFMLDRKVPRKREGTRSWGKYAEDIDGILRSESLDDPSE
ncbi:hypothetical protein BH24ACT15_BH24ACT15_05340 [soil metagenome]